MVPILVCWYPNKEFISFIIVAEYELKLKDVK